MQMAKGYWIARVDVHNMDGYKEYVAQNGAVFNKYGAKFLVRGGRFVGQEGSSRTRNVVLQFTGIRSPGRDPQSPRRKRPRDHRRLRRAAALTGSLIGCRNCLPRLYARARFEKCPTCA